MGWEDEQILMICMKDICIGATLCMCVGVHTCVCLSVYMFMCVHMHMESEVDTESLQSLSASVFETVSLNKPGRINSVRLADV